jgi:hypothetical protein
MVCAARTRRNWLSLPSKLASFSVDLFLIIFRSCPRTLQIAWYCLLKVHVDLRSCCRVGRERRLASPEALAGTRKQYRTAAKHVIFPGLVTSYYYRLRDSSHPSGCIPSGLGQPRSLAKVTPTSGKGTLGTWWFVRQARARRDKTGYPKPQSRPGTKV